MHPPVADTRRALVVDDAVDTRMLLSALLLGDGFAVDEAPDADHAVDAARTSAHDLILLDVGLPGRDGFAVCRELREFTDAYVIMLTAQDTEVDKVRGLACGADDYVTKPFSSAELLARVNFDLLDALSAEPRVAFSRATLLERVWGPNWYGDAHLVDVHVSNLRAKLGDRRYVHTVRGVGYRMGSGA